MRDEHGAIYLSSDLTREEVDERVAFARKVAHKGRVVLLTFEYYLRLQGEPAYPQHECPCGHPIGWCAEGERIDSKGRQLRPSGELEAVSEPLRKMQTLARNVTRSKMDNQPQREGGEDHE